MSNWVECPKCKVVDDQTNFCRNCGAAQKHSEIAQRSDNSASPKLLCTDCINRKGCAEYKKGIRAVKCPYHYA